MVSKKIDIDEDVYERLKAHKRGDESLTETLDRLLHELNSDWRTHVGFLSEEAAADLDAAVAQGLSDLDDSTDELGEQIAERLSGEE